MRGLSMFLRQLALESSLPHCPQVWIPRLAKAVWGFRVARHGVWRWRGCLLRDTPLWLLDEPTEGLDGNTARDVLRRLEAHMRGRSVIIATHIRREAMVADRLVILERGRIVGAPRRGENEFDAALAALRPD